MMQNRLAKALHKQLLDKGDLTCITFLHRARGMQATPYTGHALLDAAQSRLRQWRAIFGEGPLTLAFAVPQGPEFVISLLAALLGDITAVALPPSKPNDPKLAHILRDCGAQAVICLPKGQAALQRAALAGDETNIPCPIHDLDGKLLAATPLTPRVNSHGAVIIQYTSGSTRMPKGVLLSADNILANCALVTRAWEMGELTRVINWLPHYHDMGLMGCILYPILFGGSSIQMNPLDVMRNPLNWLRAISDHQGTISGGPAFAYAECLTRIKDVDCDGLDLSSWRQAFCGSEPIKADLLPRFSEKFAPYGLAREAAYSCYGMAENALFVGGRQGTKPLDASTPLTPCHLCPDTAHLVAIHDPDTSAHCLDGQEGEIWVTGDSVALGYLNLPQDSQATFVNQNGKRWLRTGDLGQITENDLFITGRIKDMLIANGRNIAATEIEWLAGGLTPALNPLAAAAFAPDVQASGEAVLLIELRSGYKSLPDAQTLRAKIERTIRGTLGITLQDICVLPRGALARTSSGKIRRAVVAKSYHCGEIPVGLLPPSPYVNT